jgi:hypothetical protein
VASSRITTAEDLHRYLNAAMQLEHATIPPYLTALYSIHPGTNSDAFHVLRVVAVEEMLHLTLAANVLNAVGGTPDLTAPGFVPEYPAYLPDGEKDFQVSRERFCRESVDTFLKIERPREAPSEEARLLHREHHGRRLLAAAPEDTTMQFYSIGEFYREIERGLRHLHSEQGDALFYGDPARQVTPEYYYSGGGEVIPVTGLDSACKALTLIAEQGEGVGGRIYDVESELAHYYRFKQLLLGRYYLEGDEPANPTGPPLEIDWNAVYPIKKNATVEDFPEGSELHAAALGFNLAYADFLDLLTRAYTGSPELLLEAVADMFRLREKMTQLIHNPIPGMDGVNAAPTFEPAAVVGAVRS